MPLVNRRKKNPQPPKPRHIDVTLRCRHTVNGVTYGPGRTRVRKDIAEGLMEAERNAAEADDRFFGTRAAIIGARNRVIPVPPEMFNEYYNQAAPSAAVASKDWAGQPIPPGGMPV